MIARFATHRLQQFATEAMKSIRVWCPPIVMINGDHRRVTMKIASLLVGGILLATAAFAGASPAGDSGDGGGGGDDGSLHGSPWCVLQLSPQREIQIGEFFSYQLHLSPRPLPGPLPPHPNSETFHVTFHGSRNGVRDIAEPAGEQRPEQYPYGDSTLSGYQNSPSGTTSGTYTRWATITNSQTNQLYCTTDPITVTLK